MPPNAAPKSCGVCKKVEKQKVQEVINCVECKKSFHEICRRMFVVESSQNISRISYICMTCKYPESKLAQEQKIKLNVVTKSCEKGSSATLISSTPARQVAGTKALTATKTRPLGKRLRKNRAMHQPRRRACPR